MKEKGWENGPCQDRSTNIIKSNINFTIYKGIVHTIQNRSFEGLYLSIFLKSIDRYRYILFKNPITLDVIEFKVYILIFQSIYYKLFKGVLNG